MPIVTIEKDEPILDITPIEFEDSLALSPPSPPTPNDPEWHPNRPISLSESPSSSYNLRPRLPRM